MCVFEIGAKPSELDVDLIVTKFCAYTSNLFGALIPMRSVVQGVPRRKSELGTAALRDAEVDPGGLVVIDTEVVGRGQGGVCLPQCLHRCLPLCLHPLSEDSTQCRLASLKST